MTLFLSRLLHRTIKGVVNDVVYYLPGTHSFIEAVDEDVVVARHVEDDHIWSINTT